MCTAVYLPTPTGFIITSNRDESPTRATASEPVFFEENNTRYLCPVDGLAGGTWTGINNRGLCLVLLNGGFEKHHHQPPYRKSRGLVVRDFLATNFSLDGFESYDLQDIEPFTLVAAGQNKLLQCVWDGSRKQIEELPANKPGLWSSSTLYSLETRQHRQQLFNQWLASSPAFTRENILAFFHSFSDTENGFVMDRIRVKTLSLSVMDKQGKTITFHHCDLVKGTKSDHHLSVINETEPG